MAVDIDRLPTLRLGSRGGAVTAAKMGVNVWNARKANTTPVFGVFFRPLVKEFQKAFGTAQSGVIGPVTWEDLLPYIPPKGKLLLPQEKPKPAVPALGPLYEGGMSVLAHDCTHATDGIPLYPAFDDAFQAGRRIIAPESMEVTQPSSAHPGEAFFTKGSSMIRYWFGHLDRTHQRGTRFKKGQTIGYVVRTNIGGGSHVHCGVNVELLWGQGKQLVHHDNYTHGAPTIGAQLAAHSAV